VPKLKFQ